MNKLEDNFGRQINYVRFAVTDRCNLRCQYCMPAHGIDLAPRQELLTFKEMYRITRVLSELGVNKIRLTGGEPFVRKNFIDKWSSAEKHLNGNKVYTEYNPYTATSRPSNRHGGVNFGALNKKDGTREIFVPKPNHIFLQLDYDAYHVRIIADMIGYDDIPPTSGHQWLADQYGCGYAESKGITFQILYGGVTDDVREIPFFDETDKFIQKMYIEAKKVGYVMTGKGRKIMLDWIENHNAQKVFNYLLQATETELNIEIIKKLHENDIDSMILYVYDSFLFEYEVGTTTDKAKKIKAYHEK